MSLLLTGIKSRQSKQEKIFARVVEWLMAPGCKPGGVISYIGSNPIPCTIKFNI